MPADNVLSPDEAYNVLVAQVHAPVFFEKLARVYNIQPQTAEEQRELLLMAGQLRNAHEQEREKAANSRVNFYSQARQKLNSTLAKSGFAPLEAEDAGIKQAAAAAVKNPLIKEAALVFNQYLAAQTNGSN